MKISKKILLVTLASILLLLVEAVATPQYLHAAQVNNIKVIVYYFHGNYRCPTCKKIERLSREVVLDNFKKELSTGALSYRVVDVEEPQNAHFVNDFSLFTKSLVLVEEKNGKITHYKNLGKIWVLIRDEKAFKDYVKEEVEAFIKGARIKKAPYEGIQ